ncbi:porin family protein [Polaribacter sp.]|uniref:porin family protein n=1 Tax=Polaribacter sp. TaxID=1920175 RepID=UPI003EF9A59F
MKKVIVAIFLVCGLCQTSNAQTEFGIKAGVNYNSNSIEDVQTDVFSGAKGKTGYHAGLWLRLNIPGSSLFVKPELVYTSLENEVVFTPGGTTAKNTNYSFQKIDVPVLLGSKVLKIANIFIGPSFQYILDSDFDISDFKDVESEGFTVGVQMGAGVAFGKFGIDIRWERGLSDSESTFFDGTTDRAFDTRVNQIIIGLSLQL